MIEVKNVTKTFDGFRALDDLTLTVPQGAVYGLVGPNGAGKSTIIRHLTGIYRQDAGTITIDGAPVFENPAVKARIAYIPDDVFYFAQATIADMMRYYRGIYPRFDAERYEKLGAVFALDSGNRFGVRCRPRRGPTRGVTLWSLRYSRRYGVKKLKFRIARGWGV